MFRTLTRQSWNQQLFFFFWRFDSCAEGDTRVEVLLVHRRAEGLMEVRALQVPENQHANILLFWKQVLGLPGTSWCRSSWQTETWIARSAPLHPSVVVEAAPRQADGRLGWCSRDACQSPPTSGNHVSSSRRWEKTITPGGGAGRGTTGMDSRCV